MPVMRGKMQRSKHPDEEFHGTFSHFNGFVFCTAGLLP